MRGWLAALRQHRAGFASGATLTTAALVVTTLAVLHEGVPTADVELDDGGVWVTNAAERRVGHLNFSSRTLDGALFAPSSDFDVLQDGNIVLVHDRLGGSLQIVDPATLALGEQLALPGGEIAFAGDTVAVLADGGLHAVSPTALAGALFDPEEALWTTGAGGDVAVSRDAVATVSGQRAQIAVSAVAQLGEGDPRVIALEGLDENAELSITLVGDQPVVLDAANGVVRLPNGSPVEVPDGAGAVLQQSGAASDVVYLATPTSLVRLPLSGGEPEVVETLAEGVPTAPVQLGGCVYAVWSGTAAHVRDCPADPSAHRSDVLPGTSATSQLVLRQNRRVVVVNDVTTGTSWIVDKDVIQVDNWDDLTPPPAQDAEEEDSQEEQPQQTLPERSNENRDPVAVDDSYGVRAGRTAILRVTENDSDPDGDLLSASLLGEAPTGLTISPVLGGAALQVAVSAIATGTMSFGYQIEDGRGGRAQATVSVSVRPDDVNGPPALREGALASLQVEVGASVAYNVLDDWRDPDGDDFYLKSATVEGGDVVSFRSDGVIVYDARSGEPGLKEVRLVVSDGRADGDGEGVLRVDVRAKDTLRPVANADRVTATAGVPVTVAPLANDLSPSGQRLLLSKHDPAPPGTSIQPDYAAGTFEFTAATAGVYYVQYLVSAGAQTAVGIVRIDVVAADAADADPIAVRDVAFLPAGRDVLVDVLANDTDPAGGILVVQSAQVPEGAAVSVEVLEHRVLRVTDLATLSGPVMLTYQVSNGVRSATGEVAIMPVPLPEQPRGPMPQDDDVVVRAGDVVTIRVLDNDSHPDGDRIRLSPLLDETQAADFGDLFVDGDTIRFRASAAIDEVTRATVVYSVLDSNDASASALVRIQILPAGTGSNQPPSPLPVTARVLAGNTVRIPIPLDGVDPDGDSVELLGVGQAASKGRVTTGDSWLVYEAYPDAHGSDVFTYVVRDRQGATAEGSLVVGIAPPGYENQAPYTARDTVTMRPGRVAAVAVTVNDSDPEGDEIAIVSGGEGLVVPSGIEAVVEGGRVVVTSPQVAERTEFAISYTIRDTWGASAQGVLLVVVDPDAPLQPPIARDDRVSPLSVDGTLKVEVPVLANDEDPDGTVADLSVTVSDAGATVRGDGTVSVVVEEAARILLYTITDVDGGQASAFVFVPGLNDLVPWLRTTTPLEVVSGEQLVVDLADHVRVRADRVPRVSTADSVRASLVDTPPVISDAGTSLTYVSSVGRFGPDTLGVLVTDGTGPDDPEGLSAYISIPITVLPAENVAPTLRNASLRVAPNEKAAELDLARLAFDPNTDDVLTFEVAESPGDLDVSISGARLSVAARADTQPGTPRTVTVRVRDAAGAEGTGAVTITVVASERPLPVANDDAVSPANAGQTYSVPVLANDFNPFEADGEPLRLLSARVLSGVADASVDGANVSVTPGADFVGTVVVAYRMVDATGATERETEGRLQLVVRARPGAPGTPGVSMVASRTIVLNWGAAVPNGTPVTNYKVTSLTAPYEKDCGTATTCSLDGLTNDVEYRFAVVATNEVGDSDPSPASATARPDQRPDQPAAPTLLFSKATNPATGGQLEMSWTAPRTEGSPILSYNVRINPAPDFGAQQQTVTGTSFTWTGLRNGDSYTVQVQAVNRAPEPSEWSQPSMAQTPAGVPDAPGQPTTTPARGVGSQAQIQVAWPAPASANGDAVSGYTLSILRGGALYGAPITGITGTSQNVTVEVSETDYSFQVVAHNKAGDSLPSAPSAPRRGASAPGAPTAVVATPGDRQLGLSFTPGALNGNRAGEVTYHYRVTPGGATGTLPAGGGTIGGLANGTDYSVAVWATSAVQGVDASGETSSNVVRPFGAPIITDFQSHRRDNAVHFTWNVNANGRDLVSPGYGVPSGGGAGSHTIAAAPSEWKQLDLSYTNEGGTATASASGQANDPPPPPPAISGISKGGGAPIGNYIKIHLNRDDSGTKTVCMQARQNGSWANWDDRYPCLNVRFTNGVGESLFYTSGGYYGRIQISGYTDWEGNIW